jgi:hypothetical protein
MVTLGILILPYPKLISHGSDKVEPPLIDYMSNATAKHFEPYIPPAPPKPIVVKPKVIATNKLNIRTHYSWMPSSAITSKNSPQLKLQQQATVDELGFMRLGEYYMCATSQYWGFTGTKYQVTLSNGVIFKFIIGDSKQTRHANGMLGSNGDILEFIMNKDSLGTTIEQRNQTFNNNVSHLKGTIISMNRIGE